jgi:glycosyltransferase involved in cell wall biosynthesis
MSLPICGCREKRPGRSGKSEADTRPEISVIILTFNRKQFLERALKSIFAQTFTDFELILIDNGSTDEGSRKECERLVTAYPAIRFIRRKDSNIGAGRNAGIDAARAPWIAFIDDDDVAYPEMLSFLYRLVVDHQADISFCGSDKGLPDERVVPQFVFDELKIMNCEESVIELLERKLLNLATPTKLFSAALFKGERFPEDKKYDDISATYKLFACAHRVAAQGVPLYCFSRHEGNNSGFTDNDKMLSPVQLEEYFTAYRERTEYLVKKLPAISDYVHYSEWSFLLSMYRKIRVHNLTNCAAQKAYCAAYLENAGDRHVQSPWIKPFEFDYLKLYYDTRGLSKTGALQISGKS